MPVFIERFLLPIIGVVVVALAVTNPMNLDFTQRITGCLALVFMAYFFAHTLHVYNQKKLTAQEKHPVANDGAPARIGAYAGESIPDPAGVWLQSAQYLAQSFSIPSHFQVEEVRLVFFENKAKVLAGHLYITSALGSEIISGGSATATSQVVRAQADITLPTTDRPTTVVVPLSASLAPGDYFIVLSTQEPQPEINRIRWKLARFKFPDNFGTIGLSYFSGWQNASFPPASDFTEQDPKLVFDFQVLGTTGRK